MIVGYARISSDEDNDSSSIEEQERIIRNYAKEHGLNLSTIYSDNNYSGYIVTQFDDTLYDRPAFIEMYSKVKNGEIDTIIVKDSTRLGRKQAILILTLERFKTYGCKVIEVSTGNDVLTDILPVLAWTSEMYVKDISKKVRLSLHNRQKDGRLLMTGNYFGYVKKGKTDLVIDPYTAEAVKLIYELYINGWGYIKIAKYLNENTDYPTPSQYAQNEKLARGETWNRNVTDKWQLNHLYRILGNEIYTGTLVNHKYFLPEIKGKPKAYDKDSYYRFRNNHEGIVSQEDFDLVQSIKLKRDAKKYRGKKYDYIFSGFCICGECGRNVSGMTKGYAPSYNCSTYIHYGVKHCSNKRTLEKDLLVRFKHFLIDVREEYFQYWSSVDIKKKELSAKQDAAQFKKTLKKLEYDYRTMQTRKNNELNSKDEEFHDIIYEQYGIMEQNILSQIRNIKKKIEEYESQTSSEANQKLKSLIDVFDEIISSETPKKRLLEGILDKIIFNSDKVIEFKLKIKTNLGN